MSAAVRLSYATPLGLMANTARSASNADTFPNV